MRRPLPLLLAAWALLAVAALRQQYGFVDRLLDAMRADRPWIMRLEAR